MEPLSAAASILAVISMAREVNDVGHEVISFLRRVVDAPQEVVRLTDEMPNLMIVINGVRDSLERSKRLFGDDMVNASETVAKALQRCREEVTEMKEVIDQCNDNCVSESRFKRISGSASLALKRQKFVEYEKRIQRLIQLLNTAMIANILEGQCLVFVT
jgi:predicted  nucleic acid-binding Zn-ribbon protein